MSEVFFDFHLSKVGGKLVFVGNLARKDAKKLHLKDDLIQELIELWMDLICRDSFVSQANFNVNVKLISMSSLKLISVLSGITQWSK